MDWAEQVARRIIHGGPQSVVVETIAQALRDASGNGAKDENSECEQDALAEALACGCGHRIAAAIRARRTTA